MELKKELNWGYFVTDNVDIYFGNRWKKKIYKKCLRFARRKINEDMNKFIGKKMHDAFNLSLEERELYNNWLMHIDIPEMKDSEISRELISNNCLSNKYLVKCKLNCKVEIILKMV